MKAIKIILSLTILITVVVIGYFSYRIRENVQHVVSYQEEVEQAVKKYDISEHKNLVLAIIYTESKGQAKDLMQSSESAYGQPHVIDDPVESIDVGVSFLAQSINQAEAAGCDLWTAVQAYNFGLDYIDFVKDRGGKNSVRLAEEYSKEILSPLLGNTNEKMYRYYRLQSVFYNGGFLYNNGGNMFYADIVRMNQRFIQWFK